MTLEEHTVDNNMIAGSASEMVRWSSLSSFATNEDSRPNESGNKRNEKYLFPPFESKILDSDNLWRLNSVEVDVRDRLTIFDVVTVRKE